MAVFTADNKAFSFMGRIDFSDKTRPLIIYAGSNIRFRFTGTSLKITLENISMGEYNAVGAVIDGFQKKLELKTENTCQTLTVDNLNEGEHTCMIFKRQAAAHYFRFLSVEADSVAPLEQDYRLKLEFFGDSVSAGEVTEALYYEGKCDPDDHKGMYDNSYFSYTFSVSRKLSAYFHNNSQGGLSVLDHTGYFYGPDIETLTGLETTYNKLSYIPYSPTGLTDWDFESYTPDVVVLALGQNDANPNPEKVFDKEFSEKWKAKYKEIILDLKSHYKNAKFILIMTLLRHEPKWDYLLDEMCAELASPDITRYRFRRCGKATDGHPRVTEQEEMALELEAYIRSVTGVYEV